MSSWRDWGDKGTASARGVPALPEPFCYLRGSVRLLLRRAEKSDALERFDKVVAGQSVEVREFGGGDVVPIKAFEIHLAKFVN